MIDRQQGAPVAALNAVFRAEQTQCKSITDDSHHILRQALPGWNVLLLAKEPVALKVEDCAEHDLIMAASGTQV